MSNGPKVYSDDELRALCNDTTPHEALLVVLSLAQRMALALEGIAKALEPIEILAEADEVITTDGSAELQERDFKTEH